MGEYEERRGDHWDNNHKQNSRPIHDYEQYMYGGYRDLSRQENMPNPTALKQLEQEDEMLFARFGNSPGLAAAKTLHSNSSNASAEIDQTGATPTQANSRPPETEGIIVTSSTTSAVPGTIMTYGVSEANKREGYSYHWRVINDLSAIARENRDGFFERMKYPEQIDLLAEDEGEIEIEWDYAGRHTLELSIYNQQGQQQSVHQYHQVVQEAAEQAKTAFETNSPAKMQPDVYLTWLETQRQLAQETGAESEQLQQLDEAIANATSLLGVNQDNPTGDAIAISATLVPTAEPIAAPLQLYLKPIPEGWAIVDLTNLDPAQARTYQGRVRGGRRRAKEIPEAERSELAIDRAWTNFVNNNPHPAGEIIADFPPEIAGKNYRKQEHSDGESTLGRVRNWFSGIGLVTGLGGLALTVATGGVGTVAVGLFLAASASGAIAGGSNIADRVQHGNFEWDGETALDLVDIAGGLAGGTTTILSLGSKAANVGRLKNAMLIGEAVETGSDVTGGVILGAQYLAQVEEIKSDPNLTQEQKKEAIGDVLKEAAATGGMMVLGTAVGANNSSRAGGNGAESGVDVDASNSNTTAEVAPEIATAETATPTTTQVETNTNAPTPETTTPDNSNFTPDISSLVDALPENLRGVVDISFDESLSGSTVRVYYQPEIQIRVGKDATAVDIELHLPTVRTLQRYSGLTGKVRALVERITNWIKQNGEPPFGSVAWEAKLELEKLPRILAAKQAVLASNSLDVDTRTRIEAELGDIESQIDYHTRKLNEMDTDPGRGFIAAENTPSPRTAKQAKELLSTQLTTVRAKLETRVAEVNQGIYELQARLDNLDVEFETRNASFEARIRALEPELNGKNQKAAENLIREIRLEQENLPQLKTQERQELNRAITELKIYQSGLGEVQADVEGSLDTVDIAAKDIESEFDDPLIKLDFYKGELKTTEEQNQKIEKTRDSSLDNANFKARAIAYGENTYEPIASLPHQAHPRQKLFYRLADKQEYVLDSIGQKVPRKVIRNITEVDSNNLGSNLNKQGDIVATNASTNTTPLAHSMGTKPSQWISTTKAETIVNPEGRAFEGEFGRVEIDLIGIDPSKIVDLSTERAQKSHEFPELSDELTPAGQATRDVVRTKEVLIKDKIPGGLVTRVRS